MSPRTTVADMDEDEGPCELPVPEDIPLTKEASKVSTRLALFRNRQLHHSISQMSFTNRPSSSEDKGTEPYESRDGDSESTRLFFGARKRSSEGSEGVDRQFESGFEAKTQPFRGYY